MEMSPNDWKDYEDRKINEGKDPALFCPDEVWEIKYLISKIQAVNDQVSEGMILKAIEHCAFAANAVPRQKFIGCVLRQLYFP